MLLYSNLVVEMLSKIVSAIQDIANTVIESRDKCLEWPPSLFTYSCQTIYETTDSFINWKIIRVGAVPFLLPSNLINLIKT